MKIEWHKHDLSDCASDIKDWLGYRPSMTARLRAKSEYDFHVELLAHGWQMPKPDDCDYLKIASQDNIIEREVVLHCDEQPVMYARTVIPNATAMAVGKELLELGTRSIGDVLFADPDIIRSDFEFAQLSEQHDIYQRAVASVGQCAASLWARRSIFQLPSKGELAITEVFMPLCWEK